MIRGTTPTLEFTLPFDTSLIAEMYITLTQNGTTTLEKTLSDCNCSGTSVSLTLTQEDTLGLRQQPRSQGEMRTRSIASTSKIKSRLTAALVINSFESRPADLVTTVTDHPERTGRYHPYVSESLLRDIRSNHTVLGCLPLLFPQCCR